MRTEGAGTAFSGIEGLEIGVCGADGLSKLTYVQKSSLGGEGCKGRSRAFSRSTYTRCPRVYTQEGCLWLLISSDHGANTCGQELTVRATHKELSPWDKGLNARLDCCPGWDSNPHGLSANGF